MRYSIRVEAYQVLDGAQVTVWVHEHDSLQHDERKMVARRTFTAVEMDLMSPERWARDVLVAAAERF